MTAAEIREYLLRAARCEVDRAGEKRYFLALKDSIVLARELGLSRRALEIAALKEAVIPERYRRNLDTIGLAGQLALLQAGVTVVGAGGLGGYAVELLARCGVGGLNVIDGDSFDPSNLNRQLYALEGPSPLNKAVAAVQRIAEINGAVEAVAFPCRGDDGNLPRLLQGSALVLDCLDNIPSRFALEEACQILKVTLVHGAVAGFAGQVAVIRPGRPLFKAIYGRGGGASPGDGLEEHRGVPSFTVAAVAARQVAEAVKLLAGMSDPTGDTLQLIDLHSGGVESIIKISVY